MDIMTPSLALGLALGRVGCLLNGCCFGNVACTDNCPAIHFPALRPCPFDLHRDGLPDGGGIQHRGGRARPAHRGRAVEPGSKAAIAGLKPGDKIVKVNGMPNRILVEVQKRSDAADDRSWQSLLTYLSQQQPGRTFERDGPGKVRVFYDEPSELYESDLKRFDGPGLIVTGRTDVFQDLLVANWPQGETHLTLSVKREGEAEPVALETFRPVTIGLHPTQIYETISALLILLLLTAYYPFRRHYGEVFVLFMLCYSIHRFINEMLRNDTPPVFAGMTLSQNGSILVLTIAVVLLACLWLKPTQEEKEPAEPEPAPA